MNIIDEDSGKSHSPIELSHLETTERTLRERVDASPGSASARQDLAWCLLMQVLVRSGYEACLIKVAGDKAIPAIMPTEVDSTRSIRETLAECLWQATVIPTVSSDEVTRNESERLIALARLVGHADLADEATSNRNSALLGLIHDLEHGEGQSQLNQRFDLRPSSRR